MSEAIICKKIKCKDYLANDGDPVWCYWAGCPASVAIMKCPKVSSAQNEKKKTTNE